MGKLLSIATAGLLLVDIVFTFLFGFVFKTLWGWFIVPIFHLPQLNMASSIGIGLVVGYITSRRDTSDEDPIEAVAGSIVHKALAALFALGVGWIVHLFM